MHQPKFRQDLSMPGMLNAVRECFAAIPDTQSRTKIELVDHLMSGMAVFGLKFPSLLKFDEGRDDEVIRHNLNTLYGIKRAPCDTYLRERLDDVDPSSLRQAYTTLFGLLQRGKGLEGFTVFNDHYLLSVDGTGQHSSKTVHCQQCCAKHHRSGETTYYHQLLGAVLVHPDHKEVFPLMPEPITQQDGQKKNDCERNAAKRLLSDIRREHPHLKLVVVEDGLASNGPHIKLLKSLDMHYILGCKASDHKYLFDWVTSSTHTQTFDVTDEAGVAHRFRYLTGVPLNDTHFELEVNFVEYWETKLSGKVQHFAWVTDLPVAPDQLMAIVRAGRARWRIENETFNTLKNHGYEFEHNFGHGHNHLSTVLMHLMMLSFLIDQIQLRCCRVFNAAREKLGRMSYLWEKLRSFMTQWLLTDWRMLYEAMAYGIKPQLPEVLDSS